MAGELPILLFPRPTSVDRATGSSIRPTINLPSHQRQSERISGQFRSLREGFDERRIALQANADNIDPDLVIVFETIGAVEDFVGAAGRIEGLEWLFAEAQREIEPDADFFDLLEREKSLSGRLFLVGTNRQALEQMVRLWETYSLNPQGNLGDGLNMLKDVFRHLKALRFWGVEDRLSAELRMEWEARLAHHDDDYTFEIEAWCFASEQKNQFSAEEIRRRVEELGGEVRSRCLMPEIFYHGFLVSVPAAGMRSLLGQLPPGLLLSERVMYFRPHGQAIVTQGEQVADSVDVMPEVAAVEGHPVVALLDGLPVENHPRLAGRVLVDDPDGWSEESLVQTRRHGTAMASLIIWNELEGAHAPISKPLYVRPVLKFSQGADGAMERTPSDRLLIDLIHSAVRRIFEGENQEPPSAPTIKVINISIGDTSRPFDGRTISPWARLLDWLSEKYDVLIVVSAGNSSSELVLATPRETLANLTEQQRNLLATRSLLGGEDNRRLISPAEALNVLTIGALHADGSTPQELVARPVLFPSNGISPYSCTGPGIRRAVKPDFLMPGGRVRYQEQANSPPDQTRVSGIWGTPHSPGHLVATPPDQAGRDTVYTRGTSNAAAIATRSAAIAYSVIEALRDGSPDFPPQVYDAVLLKALLSHGADWGELAESVLDGRPDIAGSGQKRFVARYIGYGVPNIEKALTCTEQQATLIGCGELKNEKAMEFRIPLPPSLGARVELRRLTTTLAWLSPVNPKHSKYRVARMWLDLPQDPLRVTRKNCDARQVTAGTLQHEVWEGRGAVPIVEGQFLPIRINCVREASRISLPIKFALCVTLEVAEGVQIPIYQEVRERIAQRIQVQPAA